MSESPQPPRPTGALEGTDLGDEYLFYDRKQDRVHVLNSTAREILLLCDGQRTEDDIAQALADSYGLDEATARRDTQETLDRLRKLGLLSG